MSVINFDTKAALVAYDEATEGTRYGVFGNSVIGDAPVKFYTYYENMSEPADGEYIIEAVGMEGGRYLLYDTMGSREFFTYVGKTNSSGDYAITYASPQLIAPHVQVQLGTADHLKVARLVSSDESGCVINVKRIDTEVVEQVEWLKSSATNVEDELVNVFVISR